jgi:ribosomal protein S12 methylthiotransferase accessory factor
MLDRPQFKRCFQVEILDEQVVLLGERDYFVLEGKIYARLARLIDGERTVDDLIEQLEGDVSTAEIYYALMQMEQQGYLVEAEGDVPPAIAAFWERLNINPNVAQQRLATAKASIKSFGYVSPNELISIFESYNLQIAKAGDIEVVLTDDYLQERCDRINQNALRSKRPWLLVKPVGTVIWLGPLFIPGSTGCWECLAQRLRINHPVESYLQQQKGKQNPSPTALASLPSTLQVGLNLVVTEVIKWLACGENKSLAGTLITFDTHTLKTQHHRLIQRPQCPSCGDCDRADRSPSPLILESRKKAFTADGGHRYILPEVTLQRYEHHISPLTGVVGSLQRLSPRENPLIHSYAAGHNFAIMFDNLRVLQQSLRAQSGGKGKTDSQAKASALCEVIERCSGLFQGDEIRQKDTYRNLGEAAIHPNACLNFSETQYKNRQEWNAQSAPNRQIPEPFDENAEIEWTPIWSLTREQFKYLPTAYCYYGYPRQDNPFCWANSNGAAAGNTKEEAILQGFMELVERDSVAVWWYNRLKRPAVDLESFSEPYFREIQNYYKTINREIWVLDVTADFNIPAFAAISRRVDGGKEDIIFGFGAHFDPKIGILRAITEVNQILFSVMSVGVEGSARYRRRDAIALNWWQTATLANQPYLGGDRAQKPKVQADYPLLWSDDLLEDVRHCARLVEGQGMELLVLDQTRPDLGLHVVKVIVPGMRHFWRRLGGGRLYEVPVKLGWLSELRREEQLNPVSMFL